MAHDRRTSYGVVLSVLGAVAVAVLTVGGAGASTASPTRGAVQESPSEQPSESGSPSPSAEPSPTPRPSRSPTPRPTCGTVVCPTLTSRPSPSPSRTATETAVPLPTDEPSESARPRSRTPDPLATQEEPESTAPEPVLPTIAVSEVPVAPPSFDAGATEEPEAQSSAEAVGGVGGGPSPGRLAAFALAAALLLGGAGAAGLYLTREPREAP